VKNRFHHRKKDGCANSRQNLKPVRQAKAGFSMTQNQQKRKSGGAGKPPGVRISPRVGLWVKYQLRLKGISVTAFADILGVTQQSAWMVISGWRTSKRILGAVTQTLGYPSVEAMIAAAPDKGGEA
jgi:hypothetical protein